MPSVPPLPLATTTVRDTVLATRIFFDDVRHWQKRKAGSVGAGCACLLAAVYDIAATNAFGTETVAFLRDVLDGYSDGTRRHDHDIVDFNDAPTTTHADLLLFLDTALDVAEAEAA